jgi:hypothetical protein
VSLMAFLVSKVRFGRSMVVDMNWSPWGSSIAEGEVKMVLGSRIELSGVVWENKCWWGVKRHGNWGGGPKRVE